MEKLNEEQKVLVENNHGLIFKFAKDRDIDIEEYYGLLAIGLCKAALIFDESLGFKFSTIAFRCMYREYRTFIQYLFRDKMVPQYEIISYNTGLNYLEGDEYYSDLMIEAINNNLSDYSRVNVENFYSHLSDKEKFVLNKILCGYKEREVAVILGCTKQNVGYIKTKIKDKYNKYYFN